MYRKRSIDWMQLFQECRTSCLSDREWCSQNNIPPITFYYYIKQLREQVCEIPTASSRKVPVRLDIVRLDIRDELPSFAYTPQSPSDIVHPEMIQMKSAAVRNSCGRTVLGGRDK